MNFSDIPPVRRLVLASVAAAAGLLPALASDASAGTVVGAQTVITSPPVKATYERRVSARRQLLGPQALL